MNAIVDEFLEAVGSANWEHVRLLLHPYLRWTDGSGGTVRGRTRVMSRLMESQVVAAPSSYELRDGQIYAWREGP